MTVKSTTLLGLAEELKFLGRHNIGHYVDGSYLRGPAEIAVLIPASGDVLIRVPNGSGRDVQLAVEAARRALPGWRSQTPKARAESLLQLADVIDANAAPLSRLESLNTGKPIDVSRVEMPFASDALRFFAGAARASQTPSAGEYLEGHLSIVRREPVGVVAAITPWNYPLMMAVWKIAPALAAGNTVVLKPSELTPLTTLRLTALWAEILPPGVLNVVLGDGPTVGEALSRHPDVAMIALTGSVNSGQAVTRAAADTLKRVHLELGGKAPVVIFEDADLQAAAANLRTTGYWNTGQECGAATRVLVADAVREEFVETLSNQVRTLRTGDPDSGEHVELGPLISARHLERVDRMVQRALADGATLALGGAPLDGGGGYFYEPTILTDVRQGTEIAEEEIFGPVITVQSFATDDEAIAMANSVRYGLAASIWTIDTARAIRTSDRLDFGTVWINDHLALASEMPWGGYAASGHGRDMSVYALDEYTRTKHLMINVGP